MLVEPITLLRPRPGPAQLYCSQVKAMTVTKNTTTTILDVSDGPMLVTNLWLALTITGTAKAHTSTIKITFDGAGSPQIQGLIGEFIGAGFDSYVNGKIFRARMFGLTRNTYTTPSCVSGYLRLLMPYTTSLKVEITNVSATDDGIVWLMVEKAPLNFPLEQVGIKSGMHLYTASPAAGNVAEYAEETLLDTATAGYPTILAGLFHLMYNGVGSNWYYLEGAYRVYYGGEGIASYISSGGEDFYRSSWYFNEGEFANDDVALPAVDGGNFRLHVLRFFRLREAPYHVDGLKLTWSNGKNGSGAPGSCYSREFIWYYK